MLLRASLLLLALAGFMVLVTSPSMAERLVFLPDRSDPGPPPVLAGVPGEEVAFTAEDGTPLRGWWYEATRADESGRAPPAVLFLHGNAGHWGHRTFQAEGMLREDISILLVGYRGYGTSGVVRRPTEVGVSRDAVAAFHWLAERIGGAERVVVHGRSLGGAVGAGLLRDPAIRPGGLVLESTFTNLVGMARSVYPGLTRILPGFLLRRLEGRFEVAGVMAGFGDAEGIPLLVIHGAGDDLVPVAMGRAIHAAAAANPALRPEPLLEVPGAGHNDLPWVMGPAYFRQVADFVRSATPR